MDLLCGSPDLLPNILAEQLSYEDSRVHDGDASNVNKRILQNMAMRTREISRENHMLN